MNPTATPTVPADTPIIAIDTPVLFEDEGQEEMGESLPHSVTEAILRYGLIAHFASRPGHVVFSDLNLHYHRINRAAYVSPDVMVVVPAAPLPYDVASYRIGEDGPAPIFVAEVLSDRTYQQGDLTLKPRVYADAEVPEYMLIDPTGAFLPERLILRRRIGERAWADTPDNGVGVASRFGFRVQFDPDGDLRVIDEATGRRYPRPDEADAEARAREAETAARMAAQARIRELEAELARLRGTPPAGK